ncbi:CgeB family protein [Paracoccus rhizosphaerae]|uniref:Glycosyltransferase n=1 Tax=Paracoccus rhizosphaerae TaxID=1133347 RepID=A0ABV6CEI8_9RHOB|nr:glycosyltransferase [Paracoccus rhizosphaerae]
MTPQDEIIIFGLSLSSSWGNGHATTFRALLRGLRAEGRRVLFLERRQPWYLENQDLPDPDFCELEFYDDIGAVLDRHRDRLQQAGAVIVGSYVPDGQQLIDALHRLPLRQLCFYDIDTPVTMDLLERGEEQHLARRQVPWFDCYLSFSGGRVLDRLHDQFGARNPVALYCSVDEAAYQPMDVPKRWDLGYLGTYSPDRQPGLETLLIEPARRLPQMRFVVAGSMFPEDIDWPANVERIDHLPPARHAEFYNAQRFTLNITRDAMRKLGWSPSVRLFEAAACGTPIISDRWPGLTDLLPEGRAVVLADTTEDVVAALTGAADPAAMARTARDIILTDHTGRARARDLIAALDRQTAATA